MLQLLAQLARPLHTSQSNTLQNMNQSTHVNIFDIPTLEDNYNSTSDPFRIDKTCKDYPNYRLAAQESNS